MYPVINRTPIKLRKASNANALTEPGGNAIGQNEYTQGIGFGGMVFDIRIEFTADAGAGAGVVIETSSTRNFAVVTTPANGTIAAAGVLNGQQLIVRNLEGAGWWRVKNTMAGAIVASYQIKPNR